MKLTDWARGHWPRIIGQLVGEEFTNPRKNGKCPKDGSGTDRFRFSNQNDSGAYFCACSQGNKGGVELLKCVHGWDFVRVAREVEAIIGKCPRDGKEKPRGKSYAERLLAEAKPAARSRYLESRGLGVAPGLLWHEAVEYRHDDGTVETLAAMLAPIRRGGKFLTMHVTYLRDGKKAEVIPCRKILPGPHNGGGACELYPMAPTMGIAEGVETAIAAQMIHAMPVWAALNTALLKAWEPPAGVEKVFIFGDSDSNHAGAAAAWALAHRLALKKIAVEVVIPAGVDTDWNDTLMGIWREDAA